MGQRAGILGSLKTRRVKWGEARGGVGQGRAGKGGDGGGHQSALVWSDLAGDKGKLREAWGENQVDKDVVGWVAWARKRGGASLGTPGYACCGGRKADKKKKVQIRGNGEEGNLLGAGPRGRQITPAR